MYYYGIDLLKIIGMFFITIHHVIGHGGILEASSGTATSILWLIRIVAFCGVNCYAIISGFVGYKEEQKGWKIVRYIELWIQAVLIGVLVAVITCLATHQNIGFTMIIQSLFPITFNQYWYFTAYTALFFIMPFLDMIVRNFNNKHLLCFIALLSCYATVFSRWSDMFELDSGYSFVWLAMLYIIGAIIKKEQLHLRVKKKYFIITLFAMVAFTWLWKICIGKIVGHGLDYLFVSYVSPTILIIAVCFVLLLADIKINSKIIKSIANSTFGIYLFQDQGVFSRTILTNRFIFVSELPIWEIPLVVLGITTIIFAIGLIVDKLCKIFNQIIIKALKIK